MYLPHFLLAKHTKALVGCEPSAPSPVLPSDPWPGIWVRSLTLPPPHSCSSPGQQAGFATSHLDAELGAISDLSPPRGVSQAMIKS